MRKGCDFDVFAVITNNTHSEKKCRLVFGSCTVSYSGQVGGNCGFKDLLNVELAPGGGQSSVWTFLVRFVLNMQHVVCIFIQRGQFL